jgi:hypothetical protein
VRLFVEDTKAEKQEEITIGVFCKAGRHRSIAAGWLFRQVLKGHAGYEAEFTNIYDDKGGGKNCFGERESCRHIGAERAVLETYVGACKLWDEREPRGGTVSPSEDFESDDDEGPSPLSPVAKPGQSSSGPVSKARPPQRLKPPPGLELPPSAPAASAGGDTNKRKKVSEAQSAKDSYAGGAYPTADIAPTRRR